MDVDAVLDVVPFAILIAEPDGRALAANARWSEHTGLEQRSSLGHGWLSALPDADRMREEIAEVARTGATRVVEYRVVGPGGEVPLRWWIRPRRSEVATLVVLGGVDVGEQSGHGDEDLFRLAVTDPLTGLYNRRLMVESIEQAASRNERTTGRVCLLYMDLDDFGGLNSAGGRGLGDRVLASIASRLRTALRAGDVVARVGGDEFAVLLDHVDDPGKAEVVARRLRDTINGPVEADGQAWRISAAVAVVVSEELTESGEDLLRRARRLAEAAGTPLAMADLGAQDEPAALSRSDIEELREHLESIRQVLSRLAQPQHPALQP